MLVNKDGCIGVCVLVGFWVVVWCVCVCRVKGGVGGGWVCA